MQSHKTVLKESLKISLLPGMSYRALHVTWLAMHFPFSSGWLWVSDSPCDSTTSVFIWHHFLLIFPYFHEENVDSGLIVLKVTLNRLSLTRILGPSLTLVTWALCMTSLAILPTVFACHPCLSSVMQSPAIIYQVLPVPLRALTYRQLFIQYQSVLLPKSIGPSPFQVSNPLTPKSEYSL